MIYSNFSVPAGNDIEIKVDLTSDIQGDTLAGATLTWQVFTQDNGVPLASPLMIWKSNLSGAGGINVLSSPLTFAINLEAGDTLGLLGNYYHEGLMVDAGGLRTTLFVGLMTVTQTEQPPSPFDVVSAQSIKLKYPEFQSQSDAIVQLAVDDANNYVDAMVWLPADITYATSLLAAHFLMVRISRTASGTGQLVRSETIGSISIAYENPEMPKQPDPLDFTTTPYGSEFQALLNRNFPAVAVV
jgi:hypothetical protein